MLDIRVGDNGEIVLSGRLDASAAAQAETFLSTVTASRVVDLGELQYVSSAGLGVLLATQKRLMATGHRLTLVNLSGHVRVVFHYSGLEKVFDMAPAAKT